MPKVDLNTVSVSEDTKSILESITKRDGSFYSTKPKNVNGLEQYIWRQVMFILSPKSEHHCIPVMADFDLYTWIEETYDDVLTSSEYRNLDESSKVFYSTATRKKHDIQGMLKRIEDEIIDSFPKEQWHGIKRWGKALGSI